MQRKEKDNRPLRRLVVYSLTPGQYGQGFFYLSNLGSLSIVGVGFVKIPPQFYEKGPFYV